MHALIMIIVIVNVHFLVVVHSDQPQQQRLTRPVPFVLDGEDASQWLSTRDIPRRWFQFYLDDQASNEVERDYKRLQLLNDNGVQQMSSQAFEGFPMEVLHEIARQRLANGWTRAHLSWNFLSFEQ